jgi:SPP1 family predicted phage head-tail adaptor
MLTTKEKIGRMDRRITFLQKIEVGNSEYNTQDFSGWENIPTTPTVWCEKLNNNGSEVYEQFQLTEVGSARFRIRYRTDLTVLNAIEFEGLFYEIVSVKETTRRRYLELIGVEKGKYVYT